MADFTPRELKFIAAYIAEPNAGKAAIAAGYSDVSARTIGPRLLKKDAVASEIKRQQDKINAKILDRYSVSREKVVRRLATMAFGNMNDYIAITEEGEPVLDMSGVDRDQMSAISEITSEVYLEGRGDDAVRVKKTKFKLYDARAAAMDLARLQGYVIDKQELSGPNGGPIPIAAAHVVDIKELTPERREALRASLENDDDDET